MLYSPTMSARTLDLYIERTPEVLGGRPRIAGRRVGVEHIVIWHEWLGLTADEIAEEYDLTLAEIYTALAYYFDHRNEIDLDLQEGQALVDAAIRQNTSKLPPLSR